MLGAAAPRATISSGQQHPRGPPAPPSTAAPLDRKGPQGKRGPGCRDWAASGSPHPQAAQVSQDQACATSRTVTEQENGLSLEGVCSERAALLGALLPKPPRLPRCLPPPSGSPQQREVPGAGCPRVPWLKPMPLWARPSCPPWGRRDPAQAAALEGTLCSAALGVLGKEHGRGGRGARRGQGPNSQPAAHSLPLLSRTRWERRIGKLVGCIKTRRLLTDGCHGQHRLNGENYIWVVRNKTHTKMPSSLLPPPHSSTGGRGLQPVHSSSAPLLPGEARAGGGVAPLQPWQSPCPPEAICILGAFMAGGILRHPVTEKAAQGSAGPRSAGAAAAGQAGHPWGLPLSSQPAQPQPGPASGHRRRVPARRTCSSRGPSGNIHGPPQVAAKSQSTPSSSSSNPLPFLTVLFPPPAFSARP